MNALLDLYDKLDAIGEDSILAYLDPEKQVSQTTAHLPFTNFGFAAFVCIAFLLFVVVGSTVMRFLPALNPYPLKFVYNLSQMILCAYMTVEAALVAYRNGYTFWPCNAFNPANPPIVNVLYIFYVSKVWDFWDTFFIVIGKKTKQLSFLHVYHHVTIFLFYWLNCRVNYDGDIYLTIALNGFIHTVMYTYYFVSMHTKIPPKLAKDGAKNLSVPIWWKSALTSQQLIQFVIMMVQAYMITTKECSMPNQKIVGTYLIYIFSLFVLFMNFFVNSYLRGGKKVKKKSA